MHIDEWIKDVKAKRGIDVDGAYGNQCMDLYNDYCDRVLEVDGKTGCASAKLIISKDKTIKKYTEQIKNTPSFIPQKGDIAVWTGGTYGHVAIVRDNESTINVLRTIDQNWVAQKITEENHNYTYLAPLYFLRPLDQSNIVPKVEEPKLEIEQIEKISIKLNIDANYWDLSFTKAKDAVSVKQYKAGDIIENIVAIATHPCGYKYYMTEDSYKNNINNGFNTNDAEKYEEPKVEEPKVEPSAETKTENVETKPVIDNTIAEEETKSAENIADNSENSHKNILMKILELLKQLINSLFK